VKVLDDTLGPRTSIFNQWGFTMGERELQRLSYVGVADLDPIARNGWEYANYSSYGGITYGKTASVLLTLEGTIGEDTMRKAMHTYFMRYRFTHPTKEDFLRTIEEVSGKDLRWYFNPAFYGTQVLDYDVLKVASTPVDWYKDNKDKKEEKKGETEYQSEVLIHRKGDFIFPVEIAIAFDNGERLREHWNGGDVKDRWIRSPIRKRPRSRPWRSIPITRSRSTATTSTTAIASSPMQCNKQTHELLDLHDPTLRPIPGVVDGIGAKSYERKIRSSCHRSRHRRPPQALHRLVFYTESRFGSHGRLCLPSTGWPLARSQPPCRWSAAWFRLGIIGELLSNPGFGSTEAVTTPGMILAALFAVVTLVILPGVFLGYASLYRISRQEFFRACGQNLWRFVRLAILFAIVAGIAAGILHGIFTPWPNSPMRVLTRSCPSMFT